MSALEAFRDEIYLHYIVQGKTRCQVTDILRDRYGCSVTSVKSNYNHFQQLLK